MQRGEQKRSNISKNWEFPGGKVEEAKLAKEALVPSPMVEVKDFALLD